ncbi:hypothetical protein lbkm_2683 [Lachnospiraceae bacterium KM106-2]|nr:hypothetical protein lbkm_2683 [Lachnospiraceae bacterium KM106-2]
MSKKRYDNSHYEDEFDDLIDISEMSEYDFDNGVRETNRFDDYTYDENDDEEY